jgi:hypothetical protein
MHKCAPVRFGFHAHRQAVASDSGVVHQYVQAAEFFEHLLESRFDLLGISDIHLDRQRFPAGSRDFADQQRQFFFRARGYRDFRSGHHQRLRGVPANALGRTRNQRHFIFQAEHLLNCPRKLYLNLRQRQVARLN